MSNFGIKNIWKDTTPTINTSNLVTTNTEQTITGAKTFSSAIFTNGGISTSGSNIDFNSKRLSSVATPTDNNDVVNKSYADGCKNGNDWTTIYTLNNVGSLTDTFATFLNYTNCSNNFRVEDEGTYEIMFKCNIDSKDVYASCILATNSANYDNLGFSSIMYWGEQATSSIQFGIYLKNNQLKVIVRKVFGTNTNWSTNTRIYARKIGAGHIR